MRSILIEKILLIDDIANKRNEIDKGIYTFLNPVSYLYALDNKDLFGQFDGIFADGSILVSAIKIVYGEKITRRSFDMTSMAPKVFDYAEKNGKSIYIVASKQEEVEKAVEIFKERYPQLDIIGYRNGYFSSEEEMNIEAEKIATMNPDFVIVGMGVIMQERFLLLAETLFFKTEEHKNKRGTLKMSNIHSSQLDVRLLFQCCCIVDAKSTTAFVEKNRRVYGIA